MAADVEAGRAGWPRGGRRTPNGECSIGAVTVPSRPAPGDPAPLTSRRHPLVARARALAEGQARDAVLLDGAHLVQVALDVSWPVELLAVVAPLDPDAEAARLARRATAAGVTVTPVTRPVMDALSPARTPGDVVALARRPTTTLPSALDAGCPLVLVAWSVQDPGNVGALVRAADACGATAMVCAGECADPFGWKALRGSMGSALRLPVAVERDGALVLRALRDRELVGVAAAGRDGVLPGAIDWQRPTALFVGNEGAGLPAAVTAAARDRVAVPMRAGVESLNVAVAAGILLYEAARQRGRQ